MSILYLLTIKMYIFHIENRFLDCMKLDPKFDSSCIPEMRNIIQKKRFRLNRLTTSKQFQELLDIAESYVTK